MPGQHAVLSASGSKVWINCPGSIALTRDVVEEESSFAAEGSLCHELGELALRERLLKERIQYPQGRFTPEMYNAIEAYRCHVENLIDEFGSDYVAFVEQRVEYGPMIGVPGMFGTSDCILLWPGSGVVAAVDLKYGKGVEVHAEENTQGMLYALGVLELVQGICDIERVLICIDQPRRDHFSRWEISTSDLLAWAESIKPIAISALDGSGPVRPGAWCDEGFCKVRHTCAARAKEAMAAFEEHDAIPGVLTPEQIAELLPILPRVKAWAEGLLAFAQENALLGQKYPGYKLVAGRSFRRWSEEERVAALLEAEGLDPWVKKLIGIGEAEKLVGKNHPVFELTVKPEGKPVLVPESDRRAEFNGNIDANFSE